MAGGRRRDRKRAAKAARSRRNWLANASQGPYGPANAGPRFVGLGAKWVGVGVGGGWVFGWVAATGSKTSSNSCSFSKKLARECEPVYLQTCESRSEAGWRWCDFGGWCCWWGVWFSRGGGGGNADEQPMLLVLAKSSSQSRAGIPMDLLTQVRGGLASLRCRWVGLLPLGGVLVGVPASTTKTSSERCSFSKKLARIREPVYLQTC